MENYIVEPTNTTPYIYFDPTKGYLEIKGRSIPDNPKSLFETLVNQILVEYVNSPVDETSVIISLEYFNTSTSMWLFHLFKRLELLTEKNKGVRVTWYSDDNDIAETAEEFKLLIHIPFEIIRN